MQIFNQINSRKIKDEYNPFSGMVHSATFLYILLIEVVLQVRSTALTTLQCSQCSVVLCDIDLQQVLLQVH